MALSKGRRQGRSLRKTNTIKPKSAEQGMLINQDSLIDVLNAIKEAVADATDLATLQSGIAAISIPSKLRLR
jgi:hypothetical protein